MTTTPIEQLSSLRVGTVEFISPDRIEVQLDIESPDSVALNTGTPRNFPRINGYVMIPVDLGFVVGQVSWITIQRSPYPKRSGFQDFGLIDLPFPLRKMELQPVGTLIASEKGYKFKRGLETFPSVGDIVILPTETQLKSIIESGENRRVYIGNSPLVGNAKVMIDPDRLFGRHLAVLGNTGSGKSCSVAGLIRWSLESANISKTKKDIPVNSRFIVLDPNGEYSKAFADKKEANIYSVNIEDGDGRKQLEVPLWFWKTDEWCGFTKASPKTHRTTIVHALKSVRSGNVFEEVSRQSELASFVRTAIDTIQVCKASGTPWGKFPLPKNFHQSFEKLVSGITSEDGFSDDLNNAIQAFSVKANELIVARSGQYPHYDYTRADVDDLIALLKEVYLKAGGREEEFLPTDEDSPIPFSGDNFVRSIEANAEILNTTDYIVTLMPRIKTLLSDVRVKKVIDDTSLELSDWLGEYIGSDNKESLTIIDLLLPSDVTSIITAVIARMVFEAQQRYLKLNKACLPTVLVMEEAHYFVKRYNDDAENTGPTTQCCKVFEKIAREGRKFGLGLVLSSQRPSELSPTVLSQCNSFLLHRISNDRDQELVQRLLPDNMRGILREMPSLPSQYAVLLGWASELPVMVKMRTLPEAQRPQSDDPDYWNVWTGAKERKIDWKSIANEWQNKRTE